MVQFQAQVYVIPRGNDAVSGVGVRNYGYSCSQRRNITSIAEYTQSACLYRLVNSETFTIRIS